MPTAVSASRTSSSLNGLMIAITIFIRFHPLLLRVPRVCARSPTPHAGEVQRRFKLRASCADAGINLLEIKWNDGTLRTAAAAVSRKQSA